MKFLIPFCLAGMIMLHSSCTKQEAPPVEEEEDLFVVEDIDGNQYRTVVIGDQEWMAENLRVTRLNNGEALQPGVTSSWEAQLPGARAVYPHEELDGLNSAQEVQEAYGALYNWHAANSDMICPAGWRVPISGDWEQLTEHIADPGMMGAVLKSARVVPDAHPRWVTSPGVQQKDPYGFSALPAGYIDIHARFLAGGEYSYWWNSNQQDAECMIILDLHDYIMRSVSTSKAGGYSIRCIKNQQ